MSRKYFGTDGVRGKVGVHPITPEFVMKLGFAAGKVLAQEGAQVIIGKDTRISGYMFESALEAGFSYAGVDVALLGPFPTPGIAYLTKTLGMLAGCVVSASHNPYFDNGIKFFGSDGQKLDDDIELQIEALLDQPMIGVESDKLGKARRVNDANGRYIEFCKSSVQNLSLKGLHLVLDCAHGATYQVAPAVFKELGAEITVIGNNPNGTNINDHVGSTSPEAMCAKVIECNADMGIAFDGDGDRLLMVDAQGNCFDGDDLLYILALHRREQAVVGTLMSNFGFEQSLQKHGINLIRAKVGDRYVLEQMKAHNLSLGGENSGHIICMDKHCTGDGIIAALQVLSALNSMQATFKTALQSLLKYPQIMLNVKYSAGKQWESAELLAKKEEITHKLANMGRILIRPSGTEPVVRVMVEGEHRELCTQYAKELAHCIEKA